MKLPLLDRFFSTAKEVQVGAEEEQVKGLESAYSAVGVQRSEPVGDLSYSQLRDIYLQSATVRDCVDTISRQISTLPWVVRIRPGGDIVHRERLKEFFLDPNENKENIRTLLQKLIVDVLVIDSGVIEKVKSRSGNLLEIFVRDGSTFTPVYDEHGILLRYIQRVRGNSIDFKTNEIVQVQLFPRSWGFYGTPIIETIVDEAVTLMFSIAEIGNTFTKDEIPKGILVLDGVSPKTYQKIFADLTSEKGQLKNRLKMLRNVREAKWIDFKKSFREMQLAELNEKIERIVRRNFGLKPEGDVSLTAEAMLTWTQILNYYINTEIVKECFDDVYFKLIPILLDEKVAKAQELRSKAIANLAARDIISQDEARKMIDEMFIAEEALD
jgi:hypothetical protein